MRNVLILLLVVSAFVIHTGSATGTVNPHPDEIGLYFDTNADTACTTVAPNTPFFAYLIITNPSAEEIWGIEFNLCTEIVGGHEGHLFKLSEVWSAGFLDLGVVYDWCLDGRVVGFFEPVPRVGDNVILVQLQYMLLDNISIEFFLGPHPVETIEDGLPAYADGNDVVLPLHVSSGDPNLPVAAVNGQCNVVPVETKTFSGLKCLYR
jgi:hypothetical protein